MPVAIKIMAKKNMDKSDLELAKVEIDILKIGQHPNIIKLYDIYENENYIYIIMEYCSGGDLLSYFEYHEYELPESKVCEIIHKLSMAIYYLHSYGIVHRDLKPENILMTDISDTADIRLLDFGLSKIVGNEEKCTEPYGTLSFVAPEVLQGKPYDKSVDLWSIGIITFLLLCGYLPFDDKHSEREIARQTIQDPVPYEKKIWDKYSPEAKAFVDGLLQKKPEKRYSIKEVLEHPWIKKMDKVPEKRKDAKNKISNELPKKFFSSYHLDGNQLTQRNSMLKINENKNIFKKQKSIVNIKLKEEEQKKIINNILNKEMTIKNNDKEFKYWLKELKKFTRFIIIASTNLIQC